MSQSPSAYSYSDHWKKKVALFLISQNISLFGSSVVGFSIIWYITLQTSSGLWMTAATIACNVPQVLVSLWGGVWADRYNRKYLIMLADGFTALSTLLPAAAFLYGFEELSLLLVAMALRSLGNGVQAPAVGALSPQLAPMESLTKIMGINQTVNSVLMLMSPAVGGIILGSVGLLWALMLDVATAALAIAVMLFLKVGKPENPANSSSTWEEMRSGLSYAYRHPQLKRLIVCYAAFFFLVTPAAVLSPLMVARTFGEEVWRLTANEIAWSSASVIGGIFVFLHGEFRDKVRTIALCMACFGLAFGFMGLAWNFTIYLAFIGAAGFFMPIFTTAETVFIQQITDPKRLGRVFSIVHLISASAMPIAILLFGPLADHVAVETLLIITGAFMIAVGLHYQQAEKVRRSVTDVERRP